MRNLLNDLCFTGTRAHLKSLGAALLVVSVVGTAGAATSFEPIPSDLPPLENAAVAVGDYDGDGLMDLAIAGLLPSEAGQPAVPVSQIWRNSGAGFVKAFDSLPGVHSASLVWVDVDNDGRLDLALSGLGADAQFISEVWRNTGSGFQPFSKLTFQFNGSTLPATGRITAADVNNDGHTDLFLVGRFDAFQFSYGFTNTGSGFTHALLTNEVLYLGALAAADFNQDGWMDFAVNGVAKRDPMDTHVSQVLMNNGSGASFAGRDAFSPIWDGAIAILDHDMDGREDVLMAGSGVIPYQSAPTTQLWLSRPDGFSNVPVTLPGWDAGTLAPADYDNDGRVDVLASGSRSISDGGFRTELHRWTGFGTFQQAMSIRIGKTEGGAAWVDIDNDGRLDILQTGAIPTSPDARATTLWKNTLTPPNSRPTTPVNLVSVEENGFLRLSWDAASDAETPAAALTYNVRVGSQPGAFDLVCPLSAADGSRRILAAGNAGQRRFLLLKLEPGRKYYWSVQAVDSGLRGGPFAAEQLHSAVEPPAVFVSADLQGDGTVRMVFQGAPGKAYRIESTPVLEFDDSGEPTPWAFLGLASQTSPGVFQFVDPSPGSGRRFYRAVSP